MKFLVPNYSCLQNPWLRGLQPPDLRSLCPLSSTEFVDPPTRTKFLGTPLITSPSYSPLADHIAVPSAEHVSSSLSPCNCLQTLLTSSCLRMTRSPKQPVLPFMCETQALCPWKTTNKNYNFAHFSICIFRHQTRRQKTVSWTSSPDIQPPHQPMYIHKIAYIKTFKIAPTCFDPKIIFRVFKKEQGSSLTMSLGSKHVGAILNVLI